MMALDDFQDPAGFVAGIDDDRFAGLGIAYNVAIALQHADREDFVNKFLSVVHTAQYNICRTRFSWFALAASPNKTKQAEVAAEKLATSHSEGLGLPEESAFSWVLRRKADPSLRSG
jgi:hypothetical protein